MTALTVTTQHQRAAKVAGVAGLLAIAIVVFGNYVLLTPLIVPGKAAETAQNILAHETAFRLTVVCFLSYSLISLVLVSAFYVVLKPVDHGLALAAALCRLVFAVLWLMGSLQMLGALRFLGHASYLQAFETDRLQVLARTTIAATFDDYYVGLPFFSLALTICAYLWLKSKYVPRWLSWFGIVSSAWCVVCAFIYLVFPGFAKPVDPYWFDSPMALFELILSFWLLFKGLKPPALAPISTVEP
ncbi:MAG TPA: DUF4386 domain-containing protein [Chthoniobacterales bacterium]|jgi:hypothetical protein|nr:DUF4386 domain-containing protein [Chthoniobacterales bacterium]